MVYLTTGRASYYGSVLTLTNSVVTGNQGIEIENAGSRYVYADHFNLFGANGNAGVSGFTPGRYRYRAQRIR